MREFLRCAVCSFSFIHVWVVWVYPVHVSGSWSKIVELFLDCTSTLQSSLHSCKSCSVWQPPTLHSSPLTKALHAVGLVTVIPHPAFYFKPSDRGLLPLEWTPLSLCGPEDGPQFTHTHIKQLLPAFAKVTLRIWYGLTLPGPYTRSLRSLLIKVFQGRTSGSIHTSVFDAKLFPRLLDQWLNFFSHNNKLPLTLLISHYFPGIKAHMHFHIEGTIVV